MRHVIPNRLISFYVKRLEAMLRDETVLVQCSCPLTKGFWASKELLGVFQGRKRMMCMLCQALVDAWQCPCWDLGPTEAKKRAWLAIDNWNLRRIIGHETERGNQESG